MEIKIVDREAFDLLGVQERVVPGDADYGAIWTRYMAYDELIRAHSADMGYYGASFCTEQEGVVDYLAGMAVRGLTQAGHLEGAYEGLALRHVPARRYAEFHCTLRTIGQTWRYAYEEWLPASPYEGDHPAADFEYYPSEAAGDDAPVRIYIPVRERAPAGRGTS